VRVSIRAKLALLLTLVALLPLTAALITITVVGRRLRSESFGHAIESTAVADALALRVSLAKDIEKLRLALQQAPEVVRELTSHDTKLPEDVRDKRDELWGRGARNDKEADTLKKVLANPIAAKLRAIRRSDPRISEILVTDRFGQLVAATGQTTDYYQADEDWWQGADHGGGRIFVPPVSYDQSSQVWSVDLCLPIFDEGGGVVGVTKTVFDITQWLGGVSREVGRMPVTVMLVRRDGGIAYLHDASHPERSSPPPGRTKVTQWQGRIADGEKAGWRITGDGFFQAYSPIQFGKEIGGIAAALPDWSLVLSLSASRALAAVRRLTLIVLGVGLALIVLIFLFGLFLVDRSFVRRIRRLAHATGRVAEGDLGHRIESPVGGRRLLGKDEIDDLAASFNRMIHRVQESHEALRLANELKTNFIQVASHELRTPVSYIVGMTSLLRACQDAKRLAKALQSMGAKAERLDEIIRAMFKLIQEQPQAEALTYQDVDVGELLEEVRLDCQAFVEQRNQGLIVDTGKDIPTIEADKDKLRDVLENLVINAIKFTPDGGVIRVTVDRELAGRIAVSVRDQGPGIDEADLPHIFEPFYGTADVMKHSSGRVGYQKRGIGLGLAIVKRFVKLHGGTIRVSCDEGGSVFTVSIPVEPPPVTTPAAGSGA